MSNTTKVIKMDNKEDFFAEFGVEVVLRTMAKKVEKIREKMANRKTITKKEQEIYDNWYKKMSINSEKGADE